MGDRIGVQLLVREIYLKSNQPPRSTQPGHPSVGRLNEYRPKSSDALRLGVKTDMVLFAGNTVWSYQSALEAFALRRAIQIHVYFTLLYVLVNSGWWLLQAYHQDRHRLCQCIWESCVCCQRDSCDISARRQPDRILWWIAATSCSCNLANGSASTALAKLC